MIRGSCLCGGVRFEFERAVGPFELCHCSRCQKVSGSAYLTWLTVRRADFRYLQGADLVRNYERPVSESPPPYRTSFCSRCGSQVPDPENSEASFEIPAGALDDDPLIRPDKHIYTDFKAPWERITDDLPQMTKKDIQTGRGLKITVEASVRAPIEAVWSAWTTPEEIQQWNTASPDWHTTKASVDLRAGGQFSSRMEAKDGSMGFDFAGTYTKVVPHRLIEASFGDRVLLVEFESHPEGVKVRETFDAEPTHSVDQQREGWQSILDNFARHVERVR